jgi:hypothetical protein
LREDPDAFVRRGSVPVLRATTHGTTGTPTRACFSARELRQMGAFAGLASLLDGSLDAADVIQLNGALGLLPDTFPVMVVLGPVLVTQYLVWSRVKGHERTTAEYLVATITPVAQGQARRTA